MGLVFIETRPGVAALIIGVMILLDPFTQEIDLSDGEKKDKPDEPVATMWIHTITPILVRQVHLEERADQNPSDEDASPRSRHGYRSRYQRSRSFGTFPLLSLFGSPRPTRPFRSIYGPLGPLTKAEITSG